MTRCGKILFKWDVTVTVVVIVVIIVVDRLFVIVSSQSSLVAVRCRAFAERLLILLRYLPSELFTANAHLVFG